MPRSVTCGEFGGNPKCKFSSGSNSKGKIALVTGCRRGIGKAMALALAEAGADIIGVSASQEKTGSQVEREVRAQGRDFHGYACDFSDRKAL